MLFTTSNPARAAARTRTPGPSRSRKSARRALPDAHRAVALHVAVAAHRTQPRAGAADVAAQQQEVRDLADRRDGVAVLGQPHRPADDRPLGLGGELGGALDLARARARWRTRRPPTRAPRGRAAARRSPSQWASTKSRSTAPASMIRRLSALKSARSPFTRTWRKRSASGVPRPTSPRAVCGFLNRIRPGSGSGFTITIRAPRRFAVSSAVSMRGWLVPGFWPTTKIRSAACTSSSDTLPLPTPSVSIERGRRSTRGTGSSSRAGCSSRAPGRRAGSRTRPRCSCARTCRRSPRRAIEPRELVGDQAEGVVPADRLVPVEPERFTIGSVSRPLLAEPVVGLRGELRDVVALEERARDARLRGLLGDGLDAVLAELGAVRSSASGHAQPGQSKPSFWLTRPRSAHRANRAHRLEGVAQRLCYGARAGSDLLGR